MGFEVELLAPRGTSREDLARRVASNIGGWMQRFFHAQSEPSKVPGTPVFENLTPGFRVLSDDGNLVADFVDDVTLQDGLDKHAAPRPGWYRIVSDDARILQLVVRYCDPLAPLASILEPLAQLFGTEIDRDPAGMMVKVIDARNASVALAAPLPGERDRPCEIITAPLLSGQQQTLAMLLTQARAAGFTLPKEGATHIHFDAARLKSAAAIARLVGLLSRHGPQLKRLLGTNPNCVRLGDWPESLLQLVETPGFAASDWPTALAALRKLKLVKFCDFNLANLVGENPAKQTFEVRILPAYLEAEPILKAAELFQAILVWCADPPLGAGEIPHTLAELFAELMPNGELPTAGIYGSPIS